MILFVTPLVGVWIEIEGYRCACGAVAVTPLVGVWIEILNLNIASAWSLVTPLAGVWIEIWIKTGRQSKRNWSLPLPSTPNSCYTKTKHSNRKKVAAMGFFKKKEKAAPSGDFDRENEKPIIKASICNGEQIAGFKNIHTGKMREIMLIKTSADLEYFKTMYGIETEIEKEY